MGLQTKALSKLSGAHASPKPGRLCPSAFSCPKLRRPFPIPLITEKKPQGPRGSRTDGSRGGSQRLMTSLSFWHCPLSAPSPPQEPRDLRGSLCLHRQDTALRDQNNPPSPERVGESLLETLLGVPGCTRLCGMAIPPKVFKR